MTQLEAVARPVLAAKCPEDVFGAITQSGLNDAYRRLVKEVHPDRFATAGDSERELAASAFRRIGELKGHAEQKFIDGTYGQRDVKPSAPPPPPAAPVVVRVGKEEIRLGKRLAVGDVADVYLATLRRQDKTEHECVVKLAGHPRDNDLIDNEARILGKLFPLGTKEEGMLRYLPATMAKPFALRGPKSSRKATVLRHYPGHVSLADVRAQYPDGLDFRDVAWMVRRLLEVVGFIHRQGVIHGAILPEHVLVHPVNHGAKLIDWCYATDNASPIRAISAPRRALYAPEILEKRKPTQATDIFMVAQCAIFLLGTGTNALPPSTPAAFTNFFRSCLAPNPARRPQDAWTVHADFAELLMKLVGKTRYRELKIKPIER